MSNVCGSGRLGNTIIRNLAACIIAKKHNLKMSYKDLKLMNKLNILLFNGDNKYSKTIICYDNDVMDIINYDNINFNIRMTEYYQTKEISDNIHKYLHDEEIMNYYIQNNLYCDRFNNNNDCFIHIRLGDIMRFNPGFNYYDSVLLNLNLNKIYISSDTPDHDIINKLLSKYKNAVLRISDEIDTIHFASTCKYVILSHGTFSATIGYLSYYSYIYFKSPSKKTCWDNSDLFRGKFSKIQEWNCI